MARAKSSSNSLRLPAYLFTCDILGMHFTCLIKSLRRWAFPDNECLLPLVSKVLGYIVIVASLTLKVPQIYQILKKSSVRGLSVVAFELEAVGYTIALAYCIYHDLPFSTYGEYFFLVVQCVFLVVLIYYYSQPLDALTWLKASLYCVITPVLMVGHINPVLFEALYASQHAIFFFARLPQIWENFRNKGTGELSFLSSFLTVARSMIRLFTNLEEGSPPSMVFGNVMGIVMNGALVVQILLYPQSPVLEWKKSLKEKKKQHEQ